MSEFDNVRKRYQLRLLWPVSDYCQCPGGDVWGSHDCGLACRCDGYHDDCHFFIYVRLLLSLRKSLKSA